MLATIIQDTERLVDDGAGRCGAGPEGGGGRWLLASPSKVSKGHINGFTHAQS